MEQIHASNSREAVNQNCAGIDVHKEKINVTIARTEGKKVRYYYQVFNSIQSDLQKMLAWLKENQCTVVGMESTGKFWLPVYNVLENHVKINLYNAKHIKNVPGKKTDKKDSQWIARITRHELIGCSFIPDAHTRGTRDLVRMRKVKVEERTRYRQQMHDILTSAGIKIANYMSDIFGTSGRFLLNCIAEGIVVNHIMLKEKMHGPIKQKIDKVFEAMQGDVENHHRFLLKMLIEDEHRISKEIDQIEQKLDELALNSEERREVHRRLIEVPGFSERSALLLIGEIGIDLRTFKDAKHFASWCGLAPGLKESAGKNLSGRIRVRQRYLRSLLVEVAFAATRCSESYFNSKFRQLIRRKSVQKSIIAIARKLANVVYLIIAKGEIYEDLGYDYVPLDAQARDFNNLKRVVLKYGKDAALAYLEQISEIPKREDTNNV
jgi:transposase